jgi:hypothetical protein
VINIKYNGVLQMQDNMVNDLLPRINSQSFIKNNKINKNIPYVLTGIVQQWPAMKKWSMNYLKEHYGQLEVTVRDNRKNDYS